MENQKRKKMLTGSLSAGLILTTLTLGACASLMGDRDTRAADFRAKAQKAEMVAGSNSSDLNHLDAAERYSYAAKLRLSAGREYAIMGNSARAKDQYEKASKDLNRGATESLNIQGTAP